MGRREFGWTTLGPLARLAVVGLTLNAIVFLTLASVLHEAWPIFVFAPSALLALTFVAVAFGPGAEED